MNKKWLSLVALTCAMVLTLTACSKPASSTPASGSQAAAGTSTSTATGETTQLVFWHSMDGVYAEVLDKQVEDFNKGIGAEKGINVTAVFQDWPGTDSLTAAMATDDIANMPDVIQLYGESVDVVRDYERTVWVEDYITGADSTVLKADLIPNAVSSYSIDGKMIGMPYNVSALMLYYNKTYLEAAGFSAPPKTIAEMAEMLPALVDKTDAEFGLNVRVNQYELENWIATQGGNGTFFGNNQSGHAGYMTELSCATDGSLEKFLTEWEKVAQSGAYKASRDSMNEEFAAGQHAMVIMTSSRIPTIAELVGDSFEWDVAPIPTVNAGDIGGAFPSGAGLFMLNRDDQAKVDAAWQFVQYMASPEVQAGWLEKTGYIPVNIKAQQLDSYKAFVAAEPRLAKPYDALMQANSNVVAAFTPNSSAVNDVIKNTMMELGEGTMTAKEALEAISTGVADALDEYYRVNPIQ